MTPFSEGTGQIPSNGKRSGKKNVTHKTWMKWDEENEALSGIL
jgi:hypothetical protein